MRPIKAEVQRVFRDATKAYGAAKTLHLTIEAFNDGNPKNKGKIALSFARPEQWQVESGGLHGKFPLTVVAVDGKNIFYSTKDDHKWVQGENYEKELSGYLMDGGGLIAMYLGDFVRGKDEPADVPEGADVTYLRPRTIDGRQLEGVQLRATAPIRNTGFTIDMTAWFDVATHYIQRAQYRMIVTDGKKPPVQDVVHYIALHIS